MSKKTMMEKETKKTLNFKIGMATAKNNKINNNIQVKKCKT